MAALAAELLSRLAAAHGPRPVLCHQPSCHQPGSKQMPKERVV